MSDWLNLLAAALGFLVAYAPYHILGYLQEKQELQQQYTQASKHLGLIDEGLNKLRSRPIDSPEILKTKEMVLTLYKVILSAENLPNISAIRLNPKFVSLLHFIDPGPSNHLDIRRPYSFCGYPIIEDEQVAFDRYVLEYAPK